MAQSGEWLFIVNLLNRLKKLYENRTNILERRSH
jgi:hypothetical protein